MGYKDQYGNELGDIYGDLDSLQSMLDKRIKGVNEMIKNIDKNIRPEDRKEFNDTLQHQMKEMYSKVDEANEGAKRAANKHR
jgi:hypothetical protein